MTIWGGSEEDSLQHWKYLKKYKKNGKWVYVYQKAAKAADAVADFVNTKANDVKSAYNKALLSEASKGLTTKGGNNGSHVTGYVVRGRNGDDYNVYQPGGNHKTTGTSAPREKDRSHKNQTFFNGEWANLAKVKGDTTAMKKYREKYGKSSKKK